MSSPANHPVEEHRTAPDRLESLLAPPGRRAVVHHLLTEGEASFEELTTVAKHSMATGEPTDHDRVRAAVCLTIDHVPVLEEAGLVSVDGQTVALEFLPNETIQHLRRILE